MKNIDANSPSRLRARHPKTVHARTAPFDADDRRPPAHTTKNFTSDTHEISPIDLKTNDLKDLTIGFDWVRFDFARTTPRARVYPNVYPFTGHTPTLPSATRYNTHGSELRRPNRRIFSGNETTMTPTASSTLGQIHELLAARRYSVAESGEGMLRITEVDSGLSLQAVLQGEMLFLSLPCAHVPADHITPAIMRKMLAADNGISTSHFQLYDSGDGNVTVTLNNFCKLQELGPDDEDDILSCVGFLLADVLRARDLIGHDIQ